MVFETGFGLNVTVRVGLGGRLDSGDEGAMRGVLSVTVLLAIVYNWVWIHTR